MSKSSDERDHKFYTACKSMGCRVNFLFPTWKGYLGAYSDQRVTVSDIWNTLKKWVFWLKEAEREWKSDTRPLSWKRGWKPSKRREFWRQRISGTFFCLRDMAVWSWNLCATQFPFVIFGLCWSSIINSRFIRALKPVPYGYAQFVSNSTQIKTNWIYFCKNHNTNDKPSKGWCRWKLLL